MTREREWMDCYGDEEFQVCAIRHRWQSQKKVHADTHGKKASIEWGYRKLHQKG